MSRIRTIKPAFWKSKTIAHVSLPARLVFIGLWSEADDEGRLNGHPKALAGILFQHDDNIGAVEVRGWLDELEGVGLIARYEHAGVPFIHVPGLTEHQKLDKRYPSHLPRPPKIEDGGGTPSATPPASPPDWSAGPADEKEGAADDAGGAAQPGAPEIGDRKSEVRSQKVSEERPPASVQKPIDLNRPEPLGPYGEIMPKSADEVLAHVHEKRTLLERWLSEASPLDELEVRRVVERAMAHRASTEGSRLRGWYWPGGFVSKVDDWMREAATKALKRKAAEGYAAKSGVHVAAPPKADPKAERRRKLIAHWEALTDERKPAFPDWLKQAEADGTVARVLSGVKQLADLVPIDVGKLMRGQEKPP